MSVGESPTASLYRGALLGQALSKQLGAAQTEGGDISQSIRGALLQAGVATGRVSAASLSPTDSALLGQTIHQASLIPTTQVHSGGGGLLGDILGAVATPFKIAINTAGDFANAVEGIPQGLATVGEAAYRSLNPVVNSILGTNYATPKGPNLGDVVNGIVNSTVHDFTNFDPMHPLYPLLDIAGIASGGAGLAARGGGALARLGKLGEEGSVVARAGDVGRAVAERLSAAERPGIIQPRAVDTMQPGTDIPTLPAGYYSISPFRRFFIEQPIDAFFQSNLAGLQIPGAPEGTSLQDLRAAYHIRRISNVTKGRSDATAVGEGARASQPFNNAMQELLKESANEATASEKFNALVLQRELGLDNATPEERLAVLDQYREKVLATGTPQVEGVPDTVETKAIRNYYRNLTASSEYRKVFAEPTPAMEKLRGVWDDAVMKGLKVLNIDPNEILQRSLGPAGYILNKNPEELLREQPALVQATMGFARGAHDLEQALRDNPGELVPQVALIPKFAQFLPDSISLDDRIKLIHDAFNSLSEDIGGEVSRRELIHGAGETGYLQGNTIAQKVATGLVDRFSVDPMIAEKYATGGLTNYFPQASALGMKPRYSRGPIHRLAREGELKSGARRIRLQEYRKESTMRLLKSETLGVAPFASFLQDADLSFFKAGIDRRDPITFVRHIMQRERVLTHRLLNEPLIARLALKDTEGNVLRFKTEADLQTQLGSTVAASKWRLMPVEAIQSLVSAEDEAGKELANALGEDGGKLTPELQEHFDRVIDESAQMYVRQLSDEVITKGDGMIAVPKPYVDNLIKHAQVIDAARGPGHLWQGFINRWRTAVLAYMPAWLVRTTIGHGTILFLGGVWNPVHYMKAMDYFGEGFKIPGTDVHLSRGLDRDVPAGVEQGSPHTDFGSFGMQRMRTASLPQFTTHSVHGIMNFQRRAAFLTFLHKLERQRQWTDLENAMKFHWGFAKNANIDRVLAEHPELIHHAINELDRVSYTFGQMSPWERRLAKNILPFWGWYKFVSKFVWSLPITYPGRALLIARLGQLGESDMNQLGGMPDWLRSSLMFDTHNLAAVHYISMLGLNPLGDVMNPANGFQGLIRLGQMSPVIQAALEGAGYNTLTGGLESVDPSSGIVEVNGQYINLATGKAYDTPGLASPALDVERALGGLLRSFPEIRIGETTFTGGKPTYPESIPFISEKPIPSTNPPKDVSPLGIALQYLGVAPKTYNLQKYQANLLKDIVRARTSYHKAVAKEKALK